MGPTAELAEACQAAGIPKGLADLGVENPDMDRLIAGALSDPSCGGNPIDLTVTNVRALYEAVL